MNWYHTHSAPFDVQEITARDSSVVKWAWLSIAAALLTLALKFTAYAITGSVGLLSDAVESSVNLIAALTALFALWYAVRPVDRSHNYGHEKIEFFASTVEGGLILLAAGAIGWFSFQRLLEPRPLESLGIGGAVTFLSAIVNLAVSRILLRVAAIHDSVALRADGLHLMTDVWTSVGVVVGLALVQVTGIERLDPILALIISVNVLLTGIGLLRTSFDGLMDRALPPDEESRVRAAVQGALEEGEIYHALRTRRAGSRRFVDLHVLVRGATPLRSAHRIANRVEKAVSGALPGTETSVHLEPIEDPAAWNDSDLLRLESPAFGMDLPDFLQVLPDLPGRPDTLAAFRKNGDAREPDVPAG